MVRRALPFAFFGCVLMAAVVGSYRLSVISRDRAVQQFQNRQLHAAQIVAATLESEVNGLARTVRAMASAAGHQRDARQLAAQLREQLECAAPPCFTTAAIYDASGALQLAAPRGVSLPAAELVRAAQWPSTTSPAERLRTFIAKSEPPSLLLAAPVRSHRHEGGGDIALLAAETDFHSLFERQQRAAATWPRETTLVLDADGNVLYHSRHPEMRLNNVRSRTPACLSCHETFWYVDRMLEQRRGVVQYSLRGVSHLGAFAPFQVEGRPWVAAVMGPTESATAVVASQGRHLALVMVATLVALGAAVHVTWREQRRRLHLEAEATRKAHLERSHAALTALNARLECAALEWRTTVDTIDDALVVLEPEGRIERMNVAASTMLPGAPFSWIGRRSEELTEHPPWDVALRLARDANRRNGIATERVRCEVRGQTWDLWCRPAQRTGRSTSVLVIIRDVTTVIELQDSLRRSETMAALGSLVAGVAHEVRNPLFAISSLLDAWSVQKGCSPAPFQDALRVEVRRLSSLMHELLEYGTPAKPNPQRYPLGAILHEAVRSCAHEGAARHVTLVTKPSPDAEVWVDPQRFVRVLINVIQNAIQHAPEESEITIATEVPSGGDASLVQIQVRDRGPGFPEQDLPRVFTPFFSRRAGGFGLGLAISGRIVAEHRGRIAAENHPEGGAVVTVSVPRARPAAAPSISQGATTC